jgi:hypothetical protein
MSVILALEGCHRLRAAYAIGVIPEIIELAYDDVCDLELCDESLGLDMDTCHKVSWLVDGCNNSTILAF